MKLIISWLTFAIVVLATYPVAADQTSFRCGSELIDIADTAYQIQDACGSPDFKRNVGEKRIFITTVDEHRELESVTYVSEWIYKRDGGMYILTFEGSRLVSKAYVK